MSLIEEETKLNIEVWVPKLTITENCDNGIVLTCNVENSYVEKFDWTLNGKSLSPTQAQFSGNNEKVTLKMTFKTSDTFVCIAKSATKSVESAPKTLTCKDVELPIMSTIQTEGETRLQPPPGSHSQPRSQPPPKSQLPGYQIMLMEPEEEQPRPRQKAPGPNMQY
ncbi:myelin-associated oligodendrocyte basic protein isoform X2 [Acipenser oxyrinchus oxyrinchus]|uniref:Myelin-associated oligodendrocyte basic protein isoform X2 n=1 Tax=Acipenser oxyrinchus oxyrinchus TaxID=40147 RepID=A0AAD8G7V6_ACIOX|nr:myelin-associated oligodendrocyte basic protein isoform X2 [Acipenser oxyrinchus oxyrinchus]